MRVRVLSVLACGVVFGCSRPDYETAAYTAPDPSEGWEIARAPTAPAASPVAEPGPPDAVPARGEKEPIEEPVAKHGQDSGPISINGRLLKEPDKRELEARVGSAPEHGDYWYDPRSGLFGLVGHGAGGITQPGLSAQALERVTSAGKSGVIVNDREITQTELQALAALLNWENASSGSYAGRYVLHASGELYGPNNRYLGNVARAAEKRSHSRGGTVSAGDCVLFRFDNAKDILGRDVSVACD